MNMIRKAIIVIFKNKSTIYGSYIKITDEKWNRHEISLQLLIFLSHFIYDKEAFTESLEVMYGLLELLEKINIYDESEKAIREIRLC